jgi:hypothetical protein
MKKTLFIFDFDDTLARTKSRIKVSNPKRGEFMLTPAEYAVYKPDPNDQFDYSEFDELIHPEELPGYVKRLKSAIKHGADVSIVTARGSAKPVAKFLQKIGIKNGVKIVPVGSSNPTKKTEYVEKKAKTGQYKNVVMYDDSTKNIQAFNQLGKKYPNILFHGHQVSHELRPTVDRKIVMQGLDQRIKNPETGNNILVRTALSYDKEHPARKSAIKFLSHYRRKQLEEDMTLPNLRKYEIPVGVPSHNIRNKFERDIPHPAREDKKVWGGMTKTSQIIKNNVKRNAP